MKLYNKTWRTRRRLSCLPLIRISCLFR